MHIAIDARVLSSSTGTMVRALVDELQQVDRDNRYTVIVDQAGLDRWQPTAPNFTTSLVDVPNHSLAEQTRFLRTLRGLAPDVMHFCMPQQPLLYSGATVTTFHDLTILRERNPRRSRLAADTKRLVGYAAFALAARRSDRIIAPSQHTKADLVRTLGVRAEKIAVIYEAASLAPEAREPVALPFSRFLLYVGQQSAYKNVKRLCDAHALLRRRWPDLGLVLVGRENDEVAATRAHCRDRGYDGVVFTGFLPDAQRDWLYTHAAAYVFPSFAEGFGLPGLEAMGYGAPVVSSDATCLPEIYGDAAAYFPPGDSAAMADAIARVLEDDDWRAALIRAGHARFATFSWRRMAEETAALYQEVGRGGALAMAKAPL